MINNSTSRRLTVYNALIATQQKIASVAKQEMDSAQQQSNDYGANVDRYDSYRTKMMRNRDMYAKQLANANAGIRALQQIVRMPAPSIADYGAIVITDKQRFVLSIGAGKFTVPDAESPTGMQYYFAISAQTPIYLALRGKSVGDSFVVNGMQHTILEIL